MRWTDLVNSSSLVSNGVNCRRYQLRHLKIEVMAAQSGSVIDITEHGGTEIQAVTVWMPHTLASSGTVVHTHAASGFAIIGCNFTHANPRLFFKPFHPGLCFGDTPRAFLAALTDIGGKWSGRHWNERGRRGGLRGA